MDAQTKRSKKPYEETELQNRIRFQTELEFVQLLACPHYLHHLAQHKFFEDPAFITYLDYLQYWRRSEYVKYITFPHCLYFLEKVQDQKFRDACKNFGYIQEIAQQQDLSFRFYRFNRNSESALKNETTKTDKVEQETK